MIVSFTNRFIYIAIPRTASTATYQALKPYGAGVVRYRTPRAWCYQRDIDGFHDPYVPNELEMFFRFASFRNPYTRMVSHYLMAKTDVNHRLHGLAANKTFPEFVEMAILCRLLQTQMEFLDGTQVIHRIYMEGDIGFQLSRLAVLQPGPVAMPRINTSAYEQAWYAYYDAPTIARVRDWAAPDFTEIGYSPDFADAVEGKLPQTIPVAPKEESCASQSPTA